MKTVFRKSVYFFFAVLLVLAFWSVLAFATAHGNFEESRMVILKVWPTLQTQDTGLCKLAVVPDWIPDKVKSVAEQHQPGVDRESALVLKL